MTKTMQTTVSLFFFFVLPNPFVFAKPVGNTHINVSTASQLENDLPQEPIDFGCLSTAIEKHNMLEVQALLSHYDSHAKEVLPAFFISKAIKAQETATTAYSNSDAAPAMQQNKDNAGKILDLSVQASKLAKWYHTDLMPSDNGRTDPSMVLEARKDILFRKHVLKLPLELRLEVRDHLPRRQLFLEAIRDYDSEGLINLIELFQPIPADLVKTFGTWNTHCRPKSESDKAHSSIIRALIFNQRNGDRKDWSILQPWYSAIMQYDLDGVRNLLRDSPPTSWGFAQILLLMAHAAQRFSFLLGAGAREENQTANRIHGLFSSKSSQLEP
jgi:hypothetical protein